LTNIYRAKRDPFTISKWMSTFELPQDINSLVPNQSGIEK